MNDDQRRQIFRLASEGTSNRGIGRVVGLSHPSVAAVLAAPPPPIESPQQVAPRVPAPSALDEGAPADDANALAQIRFLLSEARGELRKAKAAGNAELVQRQTRNAGFLANALGRLEKQQDPSAAIVISAGDFAAACADLDAKARAYAERGGVPRCASCDRELSIAWSQSPAEADA